MLYVPPAPKATVTSGGEELSSEDSAHTRADLLSAEVTQLITQSKYPVINPESVIIDGRQWLQFTAKCKIQLIPFTYQFYVHTDKEGSFQIIGWTFQNLWERESAKLRESMLTFHFPPPAPDAKSK